MTTFEIIALTLSLFGNIALLLFIWTIRDLIRFFFKLRRIVTRKGWLKMNEEDLEVKLDKISKFMEPVMNSKEVPVTEDGDIDFSKLQFADPEKSPSE